MNKNIFIPDIPKMAAETPEIKSLTTALTKALTKVLVTGEHAELVISHLRSLCEILQFAIESPDTNASVQNRARAQTTITIYHPDNSTTIKTFDSNDSNNSNNSNDKANQISIVLYLSSVAIKIIHDQNPTDLWLDEAPRQQIVEIKSKCLDYITESDLSVTPDTAKDIINFVGNLPKNQRRKHAKIYNQAVKIHNSLTKEIKEYFTKTIKASMTHLHIDYIMGEERFDLSSWRVDFEKTFGEKIKITFKQTVSESMFNSFLRVYHQQLYKPNPRQKSHDGCNYSDSDNEDIYYDKAKNPYYYD